MKKQSITTREYVQIVGLLTLAKEHNRQMENIVNALGEITGEESPDIGHCSDAAVCDYAPDVLLKKLSITVEKEAGPTS